MSKKVRSIPGIGLVGILLWAGFGFIMPGCQSRTGDVGRLEAGESQITGDSEAGPYARVSPRELNPNLTDEQLSRMYVRLAEVPFAADPNISTLLADTDNSQSQGISCNPAAGKDYLQGRWLIRKGLYKEAIDILLQGLAADPNSSTISQLVAEAYFQTANISAGSEACKKVLRRDPANMAAFQMLGNAALAKGDQSHAAWLFKQALSCPAATTDNSMTTVARLSLAGSLLDMGYSSAAAEQYHQVYRLLLEQSRYSQSNPLLKEFVRQLHLPLLTQASIFVQMGQLDQAVDALQEAQQLLSGDIDLVSAFTISLAKQRKPIRQRYNQVSLFCRYLLTIVEEKEEVLDLFYEACGEMSKEEAYPMELAGWYKPKGLGKPLLSAREYAAGLILCGEKEKAREILTPLLKKSREPERVYFDLARLDGRDHRWQEMIFDYGQVLEMNPESHAAILAELDAIRENIPELSQQIQLWGETLDSTVSFGSSFFIGHLLDESGEAEAAETYYRQALDKNPDFLESRIHLVELLLRSEKYEEILQWAGENGVSDPQLISQVARAYTGLGQFGKAEEKYRHLIELRQDDVDAYLSLGEVLYKEMAHSQAEDVLLRVLNNWPGREDVYRELLKLYADWSVQKNQDEQLRLRAEKRAREMLARWLDYKAESEQRKNPFAPRKEPAPTQDVIITLEALARQYPDGRIVGILLSGLYAAADQNDNAVREIERISVYYPDDEEVLKLAAELNEKAGNLNLAAELRYRIWQFKPENTQFLATVLQAMRQAGKYQQALDILLRAVGEEPWIRKPSEPDPPPDSHVPVLEEDIAGQSQEDGSLTAIRILQAEAVRLFMITRHYPQAVDLFDKWLHELHAMDSAGTDRETSEQREQRDSTVRNVTESLLWALIESNQFDRVEQEIVQYYRLDHPQDDNIALYLVRSLNVRQLYPQSLAVLEKLLVEKPDNMLLRLSMAMTRIESGQAENGIQMAREWLAAQPDSQERQRLLILTLRRAKEYEAAAAEVRKWMEAEPDPMSYSQQLADIWLEAGKLEEAEKVIWNIRQNTSSNDWLETQIKLEIAREKPDAAFYLLDEYAGKENSLPVQYMKVKIYAALGKTDQAIELLKPILESDPKNSEMRLEYSIYLQRAGRNTEAIEILEEIQRENPADAEIKNNIGYLMIEQDYHIDRAGQLVTESLEADPQSAATLDSVGWWYYKKGQFETALQFLYQSAARMVRVDSEVLEHLGDTLYRLNREKEAQVYWRLALEDVESRLITERYLKDSKLLIEKKLQQCREGLKPDISPLFANQPLGD